MLIGGDNCPSLSGELINLVSISMFAGEAASTSLRSLLLEALRISSLTDW